MLIKKCLVCGNEELQKITFHEGYQKSNTPSYYCSDCGNEIGSAPVFVNEHGELQDYRESVRYVKYKWECFFGPYGRVTITIQKRHGSFWLYVKNNRYSDIDDDCLVVHRKLSDDEWKCFVDGLFSKVYLHEWDLPINNEKMLDERMLQTATFCGQQGRISRTVRAILNGQPGRSAGQRVLRPTDQY